MTNEFKEALEDPENLYTTKEESEMADKVFGYIFSRGWKLPLNEAQQKELDHFFDEK